MVGDFNRRLREAYERATLPIGKALSKLGFTPNTITILSLILGLLPIYFAYTGDLVLTLLSFVLVVFFDVFDGSLARATGQVTKFGKVLDHTVDRYVEFSYLIALYIGGYIGGLVSLIAVTGLIMPSYVRGKGESTCGVESAGVGLFERKEKIATLVLGTLIYILYSYVRIYGLSLLEVFVLFAGLASHFTAGQRLVFYRKRCQMS